MTVGEALVRGRKRLRAFGGDGRFDALRLLEEMLARDASYVFAHDDETIDPEVLVRFLAALERRAMGEPVAYIVGSVGFFGRTFAVTSDVLVPRPETEGVVAIALDALRARATRGGVAPRVCDVGTGSGILAIVLACEFPVAQVTAIDVSSRALAVARENASRHGVAERVRFVRSDIWAAVDPSERFDCIVANLPYVRRCDLRTAPDPTSFEPALALDGGDDGLDAYRSLLTRAPSHLRAGGTLVMEAGPDTVPALATLAEATFASPAEIVVHRDLALRERIVVVHVPPV